VFLWSQFDPQQWAQEISVSLRTFETTELEVELRPVHDLATEYLNHLLIASMTLRSLASIFMCLTLVALARNPGGKKTPQESTHPTPDLIRLRSIQDLLREAAIGRKQSALKELVGEFLQ
jgi:hypothetical protein